MTVATMMIALAGLTAIGSQSPVLVAFAQQVKESPVPQTATPPPGYVRASPRPIPGPRPVAQVATPPPGYVRASPKPTPPIAPRVAQVSSRATLEQLLERDQDIRVQAEALRLEAAQLEKQRAEISARAEELERVQAQMRPQTEQLAQQMQAMQDQIRLLQRQVEMMQQTQRQQR